MDVLKLMLPVALAVQLFMPVTTLGNNNERLIEAFRESYRLENEGEPARAIEVLRAEYEEKSYEINLRLGWLSYLSGSFIESVSYYNRAISLMPYSIESRFGIVYPLAAMGNWDQVINHYKKILTIDPNNTVAHYRLGVIYYNREDFTTSHQHLEKVVNLYPFDIEGLLMLAWCKYRMRQFREARVLFERALMHSPDNESALEGLGLVVQ